MMAKRISNYYPRQLRRGWCAAYMVSAGGIEIEKFGTKYSTYQDAFNACKELNGKEAKDE